MPHCVDSGQHRQVQKCLCSQDIADRSKYPGHSVTGNFESRSDSPTFVSGSTESADNFFPGDIADLGTNAERRLTFVLLGSLLHTRLLTYLASLLMIPANASSSRSIRARLVRSVSE